MARTLRQRFDRFVDRSGEHHIWTGAKRPDVGTGRIRVDGKELAAHQVAWELAHGFLDAGARVVPCREVAACVRVEHLRLAGADEMTARPPGHARGRKGGGSMREVSPGRWELAVTTGRYDDGKARREYRRVSADNRRDAAQQLGMFVAEVQQQAVAPTREARRLTFDEAIERFLSEHLATEKGREAKTVEDYRRLHRKWFAAVLGGRRVRDVDRAAIDRAFGGMRNAGLSRSRMNQARSLYGPFFRWAKRRGLVLHDPMVDFELPTSRHVSRERIPPEAEQLSMMLNAAVTLVPDVAPILTLGAVTGMRRGELVGIRRSNIVWSDSRLTVDTAIDPGRRVKTTKTRTERTVHIDAATLEMLRRHCAEMDDRATVIGVSIAEDAFVFSQEPDCSRAMAPDYFTKRVGVLKQHLGAATQRPETIALEDEALRLYRDARPSRMKRPGPAPKGAFSYREIAKRLGRSERWAALAIASALRREAAVGRGDTNTFDASIIALRKFTSSELLDAGFNMSVVAQRQGHGPLVLMKHYAKARLSADRLAAEHLGAVVHHNQPPSASEM